MNSNSLLRILLVGGVTLTLFSCQQTKKKTTESASLFYTDSIYSKHLNEYRKHDVYLPKNFDNTKAYPIIYATDGNSEITEKQHELDSLINNHIIKPAIFIASHANFKIADSTSTTLGNGERVILNYRNFEYVIENTQGIKDTLLAGRFQNHMQYFKNELIPHIEQEFNQTPDKNDRYFYGVSNGAGFGMSLLNYHPDLIGTYLCFSTSGGEIQTNIWKENVQYPKLYLKYGSDEIFIFKLDADFIKSKFKELNQFVEVEEFKGGHYNKHWKQHFNIVISKLLATP